MTAALREAAIPYREGEPLSRHTSMGVGGAAAVMAFPRTDRQLAAALRLRSELGVAHRVLGGGSNLVVDDDGLDELVIDTASLRDVAVPADGDAAAGAGANLNRAVVESCRAGWRGLERAVGIPGSVGGAAVMNAGAYGFSMSEAIREMVVYGEDGQLLDPPTGWRFHYRGSSIPEGAAVASVRFNLQRDEPEVLREEVRQFGSKRTGTQPVGRSAGCIFRNPDGAAAGQLIEEAGLKGTRCGGAVVSPKHANFVLNDGGATAAEVLALIDLVHQRVLAATGVDLALEVKIWRARP